MNDTKYTLFNCNVAQSVSNYPNYRYSDGAQCPSNASFKSVNLPANVKISLSDGCDSIGVSCANLGIIDIVFHSPDGTPIVNGVSEERVYKVGLNYINGGTSATEKRIKFNPGGGISDD